MTDFSTERRNERIKQEKKIEELAALEHEQWCEWSTEIAGELRELRDMLKAFHEQRFFPNEFERTNELGSECRQWVNVPLYAYDTIKSVNERLNRWTMLQRIPYVNLTEENKEQDRVYARRAYEVLK